ncbi:General stress protein A [Shimia thalassica]|uniref:General stress protein A n=1 Tax=Shimia thalassica TaxID=1715693 RepID=A0A0P1I5S9_9RHOB|nr:glycosyltransferase [Shimia thalassica]CUJ91676.1 General stress protein A [Shimia thalassica]
MATQIDQAPSDTQDIDTTDLLDSNEFIAFANSLKGKELRYFLLEHADGTKLKEIPADLLFFACDKAREISDTATAQVYLDLFDPNTSQNPTYYEKLGFLKLDLGEHDAASAAFEQGIQIDEGSKPNWYGLCVAKMRDGAAKDALDAARHILDWPGIYGPEEFRTNLRGVVDGLHEHGMRGGLEEFYIHLFQTDTDPLVAIRAMECLQGSSNHDGALEFFEYTLPAHLQSIPQIREIAALASVEVGANAQALRLLEGISLTSLNDVRLLKVFLKSQTPDDLRSNGKGVLFDHPDMSPDLEAVALFLIDVFNDDLAEAHRKILKMKPRVLRAVQHETIELVYKLLGAGLLAEAETLIDSLQSTEVPAFYLQMALIDINFRRQHWDAVDDILANCSPNAPDQDRLLLLKTFEQACFKGRIEDAEQLLPQLVEGETIEAGALPSILRFAAEKRDWAQIRELTERTNLVGFDFDQTGDIVFRAFSHSDDLDALLAMVKGRADWRTNTHLKRLRVALLDHLAMDRSSLEAALQDPDVQADKVTSTRLQNKLSIAPMVVGDTGDEVIFLCTSNNYRAGTAVTVMSLIEKCPDLLSNCRLMIVTEDDDTLTPEVMNRITSATGVQIQTHVASDLIEPETDLDSSYGVFTSGHELASSAYYRIFAARHLVRNRLCKRALYVDSDVLINSDLESLFEIGLRGAPIGARREVTRPEVQRAEGLHGIKPGHYFNSGVLVIEATHADCGDHIDASIDAISNNTLLFHDQCALNIGFKDAVFHLPERYNRFVPPSVGTNIQEILNGSASQPGEAVILHYLDRPKPWDAFYNHPIGLQWLSTYGRLSSMIGPSLSRTLLGMNPKEKS